MYKKDLRRAIKNGIAIALCFMLGIFTLFPASVYAIEAGPSMLAADQDVGHLHVDAGQDITITAGESVTLGGSPTIEGANVDFILEWTSSNIDESCSGFGENPVVHPQATTIYTLKVSDHKKQDGSYQHIEIDTVKVTVIFAVPRLSISKTVKGGTTPIYVGDDVVYIITVSNATGAAVTDAIVEDILPAELGFKNATQGAQDATNPNKWVWQITGLGAGQSISAEITAKALKEGQIENTAVVKSIQCPEEQKTAKASITVEKGSPNIIIGKYVNINYVFVNDTVTYTLDVQNTGTASAEGVVVTDILPAGLELVPSTLPSGIANYDGETRTLTWNIGTFARGEERRILSFSVKVTESGRIENTASVTWTGAQAPKTDTTPITAVNESDLIIEKSVDKSSVTVGQNVVFTISARYLRGYIPAMLMAIGEGEQEPDIVLVDKLPDGLEYVSDDSPAGNKYDPATGKWDITNVQESGEMVLHITAKVTKAGAITNSVAGTINQDYIEDSNSENNSASATVTGVNPIPETPSTPTTVVYYPDFTIVKTADKAKVEVGDNITYTLTAKNIGSSGATDVKVTDVIPFGLEYVSDNSNGAYNRTTGVWTIGFMNINQEAKITITCKATGTGSIINTASITGPSDVNLTNNTSSATVLSEQAAVVEVPEEPIPGGMTELPKTGGIPAELFYGLGTALLIAGIGFKKKRD